MKHHSVFAWGQLLVGILMIILGIITIVRPEITLTSLVILYGIVAVITGICDIIFYVQAERYTGFGPTVTLITGILSVMSGVMLAVYPNAGKWIMSLLFPIWFIAHCISRLSQLNILRFTAGNFSYYLALIANVLGLILGILMIIHPIFSLLTFSFIIGVYMVILGLDHVLVAIQA